MNRRDSRSTPQQPPQNGKKSMKQFKEASFVMLVSILVFGAFILAFVDEEHRSSYMDLTKNALIGYGGWMVGAHHKGKDKD